MVKCFKTTQMPLPKKLTKSVTYALQQLKPASLVKGTIGFDNYCSQIH
uniref:Uncharacterized protein n=1 Tax=Rhizophora mucronata TaxID=61149 RepID=A0A2P2Q2I8_RHIMU